MGTMTKFNDRTAKPVKVVASTSPDALLRHYLEPKIITRRCSKLFETLREKLPTEVYSWLRTCRRGYRVIPDMRERKFISSELAADLARILPTEVDLRKFESEMLAAATHEATAAEIAMIFGAALNAKASLKAEDRQDYIQSVIFFLRFEAECEPFSGAALADAMHKIVTEQKFLPEVQEIIPEILASQTRLRTVAGWLDIFREFRHGVDDILIEAGWSYQQLGIPDDASEEEVHG